MIYTDDSDDLHRKVGRPAHDVVKLPDTQETVTDQKLTKDVLQSNGNKFNSEVTDVTTI